MDQTRKNSVHQINYLASEMDAIYHQASLKLGITDSVSRVLYTIYDIGDGCLLRDIYKKSGVRKQTINSAIRSLEAAGILYLEQHIGRTKKIILTEKGNAFVQKTAAKIYQAEIQAFDTWSEDEISSYIHLMKKYHDCLRRQIEQL